MTTTRIAVTGAAGRMGKMLIEAVSLSEHAVLAAAIERPESTLVGSDAGELAGVGANGVKITGDLVSVIDDFDVLIDFTAPVATLANAQLCAQNQKGIVVGTTGFSAEEEQQLLALQSQLAMCKAANFSTGVNVCLNLLEKAAEALGDDYDVEVYEASEHIGGMSRSFDLWGQRVDLGPHRFFSKERRVNKFFTEILSGEFTMVNRLTRIYYKNRFFQYPLKLSNVLLNLNLFTIVRILWDYFIQRIKDILKIFLIE